MACRSDGRLLQPTAAAAARDASTGKPRLEPAGLMSNSASAFGSSSQRFSGAARPASASANRHGSRTPSWRAGVR